MWPLILEDTFFELFLQKACIDYGPLRGSYAGVSDHVMTNQDTEKYNM